ncbi:MAG: hypothetical protein HY760_02150 [Nitrospirae bacterium]|nr:hypothetical protein [Nitrospirota bacterium]
MLLINVGGKQTFFTILWDGDILMDRQIPWGEDRLVERLVHVLKVEQEEARRMLYTYGINPCTGTLLSPAEDMGVLFEEAISGTIFEITARDLEEFAAEAEKILIYCASENRGAMIDQTYLLGGSTYLLGSGPFVKNFHVFLEKRLGIQVKTMNTFGAFEGTFKEPYNPSLFGVSLGLALRGWDPHDP